MEQRLKRLANKYNTLIVAIFDKNGDCVLKPKQKKFFLLGFALANLEEDVIFKICWYYGRCPLEELEVFFNKNKEFMNEFNIKLKKI